MEQIFWISANIMLFPVQEVKEQRAQVDLHMMLYLQEEGSGKEKNAMFIASHEHIVELERSIGEYRKAEQASLRALHEASAARDRASMQQATQVREGENLRRRQLFLRKGQLLQSREVEPLFWSNFVVKM